MGVCVRHQRRSLIRIVVCAHCSPPAAPINDTAGHLLTISQVEIKSHREQFAHGSRIFNVASPQNKLIMSGLSYTTITQRLSCALAPLLGRTNAGGKNIWGRIHNCTMIVWAFLYLGAAAQVTLAVCQLQNLQSAFLGQQPASL